MWEERIGRDETIVWGQVDIIGVESSMAEKKSVQDSPIEGSGDVPEDVKANANEGPEMPAEGAASIDAFMYSALRTSRDILVKHQQDCEMQGKYVGKDTK